MPREDPNAELSRQSYWDKRYDVSTAEEKDKDRAESYDWLKDFGFVRGFLIKYLPGPETEPRILHLGNGNSVGFAPASFSSFPFFFSISFVAVELLWCGMER